MFEAEKARRGIFSLKEAECRYKAGVGALLLLYLAFAFLNIFRLPPLNGPDEGDHLQYVKVLREQRNMPVLPRFTTPNDPRCAEQAQHPPLYYILLAFASYVVPDYDTPAGQRALKFVSVFLGLLGLAAVASCARRLWPDDEATALAAVGFLALLPMYWMMTSLINNSAGSLAASGLTLMFIQRALTEADSLSSRSEFSVWLTIGIIAGLGIITKMTAVWLVPVILVALWLYGRKSGRRLKPALACLSPIMLFAGVWLAYNWLSFGELLPERVLNRRLLPLGFFTIVFHPQAQQLLLFVMLSVFPLTMLTPFWLLAPYYSTKAGWAVLLIFLGPPVLAGLYALGRHRRALWEKPTSRQSFLLACLAGLPAAWLISLQAVLHDWNAGICPGRYAVEATPALAFLIAAGMRRLWPARLRMRAVVIWLTGILGLSIWMHLYMARFLSSG